MTEACQGKKLSGSLVLRRFFSRGRGGRAGRGGGSMLDHSKQGKAPLSRLGQSVLVFICEGGPSETSTHAFQDPHLYEVNDFNRKLFGGLELFW